MAVTAFLQEEKRIARFRTRQCEAFLAHKIAGVLEEPEVRQALYDLRKKTVTDLSSVLRPEMGKIAIFDLDLSRSH